MTGLLEVAAAAAILAIGFLPCSECLKGSTKASTLLWTLPVTLTQIKEQITYNEIPCKVLQLKGPLPPSQSVKLTGSGWSTGRLEFLISQQGAGEVDQAGDAAVGTPLYSLSVDTPAESGEENNPDAGKILLTEYPSSPTEDVTTKDISLPVHSAEYGFMFVCGTDTGGQRLKCKVSGYDNKQEDSTGKWQSTEIELPLHSGTEDLRFSVLGHQVESPKLYATSGLQVSTEGPSLGCYTEAPSADHTEAPSADEMETPEAGEEQEGSVGGYSASAAEQEA